ncbi:MAG TPA: EscU/YscU/HrcU family type III secretion system export apparatus switch protein [Bacilli bacterium]|nr:EscU/YscU/HrcU family type III secretion system export apparatus switch protein [Bacilli bacterium]
MTTAHDPQANASKKAVALQYNVERDAAPRVVAAGRGAVADKILDAAEGAGVPLHEDKALVETLLAFEVGKEIPSELYNVVAEVLAFVQFLDKKERD